MQFSSFSIADRLITANSKPLVIAEIGINHDGCVQRGLRLVEAAAECGADGVKFQTFRADRLMKPSPARFAHQIEGGESAYGMFRRLELSWDDHGKLKSCADDQGILFLSTPFDEESADFLDSLGVPAFKIASSDINHLELLRHVARKNKPILLSTGMSYLDEVADAVQALENQNAHQILLLHCVSSYPAPQEALNLRAIQTMRDYFSLPVGYSDHSQGILYPVIAAVLGARVIEKHFTLDRSAPGPDHRLSSDPEELRRLVRHLRTLDCALGDGRKRPADVEAHNRILSRRSIVAAVDIREGETIFSWMLDYKRPGDGLSPRQADEVIGLKAVREIRKNDIIRREDLAVTGWSGSEIEEAAEAIGRS